MSANSPTQRARAELKRRGWPSAIVEHFNPHVQIRQDLFGVFDLLAIRPISIARGIDSGNIRDIDPAILGIQVTSDTNRSKRRAKLQAWEHLQAWTNAGGVVELWTWGKKGARGKRKLWELNVETIRPNAGEPHELADRPIPHETEGAQPTGLSRPAFFAD